MRGTPDYYAVLGIARASEARQIRAAYVRLIKAHHPDSRSGTALPPDRLLLLQKAYACLKDPELRKLHDHLLSEREEERSRHISVVRRRLRSYDQRRGLTRLPNRPRRMRHWPRALGLAIAGTLFLAFTGYLTI